MANSCILNCFTVDSLLEAHPILACLPFAIMGIVFHLLQEDNPMAMFSFLLRLLTFPWRGIQQFNQWIRAKLKSSVGLDTSARRVLQAELVTLGFTLMQIGEWAIAIGCWVLLACLGFAKALGLEIEEDSGKKRSSLLRFLSASGTIIICTLLIMITDLRKPDTEPWSNFQKIWQKNLLPITPTLTPQRTYIKIGEPGTSGVSLSVGKYPFLSLQQTNGDYVAHRVVEHAQVHIADLPFAGALQNPKLAKQIEEREFDDYRAKVDMSTLASSDFVPHESTGFGNRLDHGLTDKEIKGIRKGSKVLMLLGFANWSDDAGRHGQEVCQVVVMIMGKQLETQGCAVHAGYIENVNDSAPATTSNPSASPFQIFLESDQPGLIETTGLGTGWWIVNKKNNTACSAKRMIYVRVVNMRSFSIGISRFDVELKRTSDGDFTKIPVINFGEDSTLYTRKNATSWTAYKNRDFLRTEMSSQPLQPHVPVRGWVPLDFPSGMRNFDAFATEFRISIVASDGSKSSVYPPQMLIDESGLGVLMPDGDPEDLSQLTIEQPCNADFVW